MARSEFPIKVRSGSVTVRIYRFSRKGRRQGSERTVYAVGWHVAGVRYLRQFADLEVARSEARHRAEALAAGRSEAATSLAMSDVQLVSEVRRICGRTPPLAAIEEWRRAKDLAGENLLVAAQAWADAKRARVKVTVAEAVDAFLTAKDRAGVDTSASYRAFLPRLSEDFGKFAISAVTASMLEEWIHATFGREETEVAHPGTFNTGRKRLVALWRWARKQGMLPDIATTEAEKLELMREKAQPIGTVTLRDFARILTLLYIDHPEHLAVAVLAGFAGLRRVELHAQRWADIDLTRDVLRVTGAKLNTVSYRLVHLSPAAVDWLKLCPRVEGPDGELVSAPWGLDRVRAFAREEGIPCPPNAFRHAFISYRCAATGNVSETAHEAGNSPAVVHKHYRELYSKADGAAWFNLTHEAAARLAANSAQKGV